MKIELSYKSKTTHLYHIKCKLMSEFIILRKNLIEQLFFDYVNLYFTHSRLIFSLKELFVSFVCKFDNIQIRKNILSKIYIFKETKFFLHIYKSMPIYNL